VVVSPLKRKLFRDIRRAGGQFAAAAVVVVCAVGLFIGMYSTYYNLCLSRDSYYEEYLFADFFVELERAPVTALGRVASIPGVRRVRGRIVKDVPLEVAGNEESVVGRLVSMPPQDGVVVNDIHIVSGSYFRGADEREVIVNQRFCEANGLRVGDSFKATINERQETLFIVGTALSPEYVYPLRTPQQFAPNDRNFGIVFVKDSFAESAFNMGGAFNNLVGRLAPGVEVKGVLDEIEKRLESYGVYWKYGRDEQLSNRYLESEIEGLRSSALALPLVFLIIAALVLHIVLDRMTEQQRSQIGLLVSLGYSRWQVAVHYLGYAVVVGVAGGLPGCALGYWLASQLMAMYVPFFRFPVFQNRFYPELAASALLMTVSMCVMGALRASGRALRTEPAVALRPKAPPSARAVLLERVRFIWRRLPLVWRTTIRNVFRTKARSLLTVGGVVVATVLLVVGMSGTDMFDFIVDYQFNRVDSSDLRVDFVSERPLSAVMELSRMPGVRHVEGVLQCAFEFRNGWRKKTVPVMGLPPEGRLYRIYDGSGTRVALPQEGFVIPEFLAQELELAPGQEVEVDPYVKGKEELRVRTGAMVQDYLGLTAYASRRYLCRILGEGEMVNGALISAERGALDRLLDRLDEVPAVATAVAQRRMMQSFQESVAELMAIMTGALTVFAGVIAFAVIYSASMINMSERERELACLQAMGWDPEEVAQVATGDIMPLGVLGIAVGLPLARALCGALAKAYQTDLYRLPAVVSPGTYATATALVMVFLLIARAICRRKSRRIDIIAVLKTRE